MTYIDNLKYEHIIEDKDSHFPRARIIYHECRGDPLQNFKYYYKTIFNNDLMVTKIALAIRQCHPPLKQSVTTFISRAIF